MCLVAAIVLVTTWVNSYGQIYRVSLTWFGPCEMQLTQGQAIFTRYVAIGTGEDDDDDRPSTSAPSAQPITWERHLPGIWYGRGARRSHSRLQDGCILPNCADHFLRDG